MDSSLASWLVVLLAVAAANLPFLSERLFGLIPLPSSSTQPLTSSSTPSAASTSRSPDKSFWWRLVELAVLYLLIGLIGRLIEGRLGNVFPQTWEFYAIGAVVFLVLAYPGFAYRYLRKRRQ